MDGIKRETYFESIGIVWECNFASDEPLDPSEPWPAFPLPAEPNEELTLP